MSLAIQIETLIKITTDGGETLRCSPLEEGVRLSIGGTVAHLEPADALALAAYLREQCPEAPPLPLVVPWFVCSRCHEQKSVYFFPKEQVEGPAAVVECRLLVCSACSRLGPPPVVEAEPQPAEDPVSNHPRCSKCCMQKPGRWFAKKPGPPICLKCDGVEFAEAPPPPAPAEEGAPEPMTDTPPLTPELERNRSQIALSLHSVLLEKFGSDSFSIAEANRVGDFGIDMTGKLMRSLQRLGRATYVKGRGDAERWRVTKPNIPASS